jgi:hypothetical protein
MPGAAAAVPVGVEGAWVLEDVWLLVITSGMRV